VAAARDPQQVGRHDEETLRRFLAARRAGDDAGARRWWDALLTDNFDRVRGMVALQARGRLSPDEQEEALQRALIRMANKMIHTFRGTSMGEWVESTRSLVRFLCMDTQRDAATMSRRERSLHEPAGDAGDDDAGRWDAQVYAAIEERRREQESREDEAEALAEGRAFLDWAVPQLSPQRRAVLELDRAGVPVQEIQERLDVSRDVVYASRSRGLKDLIRLRDRWAP
jgi:RNA polymerase sigma factor (sigma-70 family)